MQRGQKQRIYRQAALAASASVLVDVPDSAGGVMLFISVANQSSANFTVSIQHVDPANDANTINIITTAAISANGLVRLGVLPNCTAQANIIANEVLGSKIKVVITRTGGTADFEINAAFYK